jgi:hypothetical protein
MKPIRTHLGRAGFREYDHHGLRVFRDLAGTTSYLGLIAFSITGRRLSPDDEKVLDDLAVSSHVPEPRVWPMKLTRVAGALGRAMPAYLCGATVLDSDLLGGRVAEDAARLLVELRHAVDAGPDREAAIATFVDTRKRLIGFGVPYRDVDERVLSLRACLERRGRADGGWWRLGEDLWRVAKARRNLVVNIIGGASAALLDLGFDLPHVAPMAAMLLTPTLLANAVEAAAEPAADLLRLPDEAISYVGPAPRKSKRASEAR